MIYFVVDKNDTSQAIALNQDSACVEAYKFIVNLVTLFPLEIPDNSQCETGIAHVANSERACQQSDVVELDARGALEFNQFLQRNRFLDPVSVARRLVFLFSGTEGRE